MAKNRILIILEAAGPGKVLSHAAGTLVGVDAGGGGPHAANHQNGGSDEVSVAGLSGLLADAQTPLAHAHPTSEVTGLDTALSGKQATSEKAQANGYASLGAGGLVPMAQLASGTPNGAKFIRDDGTLAAPPGGGGGGSGVTTVNFGVFPGASDAKVDITGQTSIVAGSVVEAFVQATATADHSADEHWLESIGVLAGNIVAGTGFTVYAKNTGQVNSLDPLPQDDLVKAGAGANLGPGKQDAQPSRDFGGVGTRLYGQFTIGWRWS